MSSVMIQSRKGPSRHPRSHPDVEVQETDRRLKTEAGVPSRILKVLLSYHNQNNLVSPEIWRREDFFALLKKERAVHSSLWATNAEWEAIVTSALRALEAEGALRFNRVYQTYRLPRTVLKNFYRQIEEQRLRESQAVKVVGIELSLKERAVQFQEQRTS